MHRSRITAIAGLVAALSFAGAGCSEEGPAEQAGKAIDDAAEAVQEGMEDLRDGPLEEAGEEVDEAVDEAKDEARDALE